jgi:hypothetical protein
VIEAEIEEVLEGLSENNEEDEKEEGLEEEKQIDMMVEDPLPKNTKLARSPSMYRYFEKVLKRMPGRVCMWQFMLENELMGLRMQNSNTQRSMNSYFAKKN